LLLSLLNQGQRVNTVARRTQNLKKFIDFVMLWDFEFTLATLDTMPLSPAGPYLREVILEAVAGLPPLYFSSRPVCLGPGFLNLRDPLGPA